MGVLEPFASRWAFKGSATFLLLGDEN